MLCLADAVESAQGDCGESNFFQAQRKQVYSYGNRLLCDWKERKAWFRWGNGETYRKFFTDYQSFLRRPVVIGRAVAGNVDDEDRVYVVSLDISKFYDHVDRNALLERLLRIADFYEDTERCQAFWQSARKILGWEWNDHAREVSAKLGLTLGNGLPQGLVASGFFANAYLTDFDWHIGRMIGHSIPRLQGVFLHDYCRYVDDLRLVVSVEEEVDVAKLGQHINRWVSAEMRKWGGEGLILNENKIKVTALPDLDNRGSVSARVANLQQEISGPADRESLESTMGVLEGLLTLQTDGIPDDTSESPDAALFSLARFDNDVRPDTLKRFAANRLESVMRNKRKIRDVAVGVDGSSIDPTENESELLGKKLVWAWMQDPSLALVLRKALEIFPSATIAEPVFEAVFRRCGFSGEEADSITAAMMQYVLADLFRGCVDFHGYFQRIDYPGSSDPVGLLAMASGYAQRALATEALPRFLERQALLLLAVLQRPAKIISAEETIQHSLHGILSGAPPRLLRQRLALYEVAAQITGSPDEIASLLVSQMQQAEPSLKAGVIEDFAKRGSDFWVTLWRRLKRDKSNKEILDGFGWAAPLAGGQPSPIQQRLSKIITSSRNGFVHESALLKLALALLAGCKNGELVPGLSPDEILIKQTGKPLAWDEVWRPGVSLSCKARRRTPKDPRFEIPTWIQKESAEPAVIYWIGTILRSAVVGAVDFTGNRWKRGKVVGYKGLRTGWFKRRMGMMHAPEALVGEFSTISGWSAELLMKCLQWPGFESTHVTHDDISSIEDLESLEGVLSARLSALDDLVCVASDMPAIVTRARRPRITDSQDFRLVSVQQLLPRSGDVTVADPYLNEPSIKARNRNHLARLCQITLKTLTAKLHADGDESRPCADLIVFPELGVHPDDQDLIKRLADKSRSMILAGLVFTDREERRVNVARWFIPDYRDSGRQWIIRDQGKAFPTDAEMTLSVLAYRPCQHIIEIEGFNEGPFRLSGSICYDATDLRLASDLKKKTDLFVIVAHNRDVTTFDTMASALHYHMYQHVALVNKGEFGGSTIQAPYREQYDRLIAHVHGSDQIAINVADLDLAAFKRKRNRKLKSIKTAPAGD
jgi:hypothetical protein